MPHSLPSKMMIALSLLLHSTASQFNDGPKVCHTVPLCIDNVDGKHICPKDHICEVIDDYPEPVYRCCELVGVVSGKKERE